MKVLQIDKYFYFKGGAETVFFNTIDLLERKGHKVIPFSLKSDKNLFSEYEKYFVDYPELSESNFFTKIKNIPNFIYNKQAASQLEELLSKERPDIAHIHLMFNSMSVSILPVLKRYNIPIVMTVHDYRLVCPAYTFKDGKGNFCEKCRTGSYYNCIIHKCSNNNIANSILLSMDSYFRSMFYQPIKLVDKFIFVSKFSQNKHIDIDPLYKQKSTYIYNFTPMKRESKKERGNYFIYFGRLSQEKGIETLVKAVKKSPFIRLKVLGTGPLLESLKREATDNIEFLGFKQGEELRDYIKNAMYVVVPSECYENNPMAIVESTTIGTPIIGSNIGGIPELIDNTRSGFLFNTGSVDSLQKVLYDALSVSDEKYKEIVESAFNFASNNFSEDAHYEKLMSVYNSII